MLMQQDKNEWKSVSCVGPLVTKYNLGGTNPIQILENDPLKRFEFRTNQSRQIRVKLGWKP